MFFILSKTLGYLVQPLVLVALLLLISLVVKGPRWKQSLRIGGVVLLFFFCNRFIANEVITLWELPGKPFAAMRSYDVAIVLTGVAVTKPSGPTDRTYYQLGADRVIHTAHLYRLGLIKRILLSGGVGKLVEQAEPEAIQLKKSLLVMGVPDSIVYTDPSSDNTYENAVESKRIIDSLGIEVRECLLVTSAFHMRRALACFEKAGMDVDYFTCDFRASHRSFTPDVLFIPSIEALSIWQKLLKEWMGFVAYKAAGYL